MSIVGRVVRYVAVKEAEKVAVEEAKKSAEKKAKEDAKASKDGKAVQDTKKVDKSASDLNSSAPDVQTGATAEVAAPLNQQSDSLGALEVCGIVAIVALLVVLPIIIARRLGANHAEPSQRPSKSPDEGAAVSREVRSDLASMKGPASISANEQVAAEEHIYEVDNDFSAVTGRILVSWFMANPLSPNSHAVGFIQKGDEHYYFYRCMNFSGYRTWVIGKCKNNYEDANPEFFGDLLIRAQIYFNCKINSEFFMMFNFPDFVCSTGHSDIDAGFIRLMGHSLGHENWAIELFLLDKFGSDCFAKGGWKARLAYEMLRLSPNFNPDQAGLVHAFYQKFPTYTDWAKPDLPTIVPDVNLIVSWFRRVTDRQFEAQGLYDFAEMWTGVTKAFGKNSRSGVLMQRNRIPFRQVTQFFNQFQMPLWSSDWDDAAVGEDA